MKPIVKIADHSGRLIRRDWDVHNGKPVDEEEFDRAFEEACQSIWGCTLFDVDCDLLPTDVDDNWYEFMDDDERQKYAEARGYDLQRYRSKELVPMSERFLEMIEAEEHNAIARTNEQKTALRLKQEAEAFVEDRQSGVLSGR